MKRKQILEINATAFDSYAENYIKTRWGKDKKNYGIVKENIIKFLKPGKDDAVLDVGCGPGTWSKIIAKHAKKVVGIDVSPSMIETAKKNCKNCIFKVAPGENIPYKDAAFTKILSVRAIEYSPNKIGMLKEFNRVLKQDGKVVIVTKSTPCIWRIPGKVLNVIKEPARVKRLFDRMYKMEYWMEKISPPRLRKMLKACGFRDIEDYALTFSLGEAFGTNESLLRLLARIFRPFYYLFCESYIVVAKK